jgi:hypothetical protein
LYNLIAIRLDYFGGVYTYENDISAEKTAAIERAWLQETHEDFVRPRYPGPSQIERKKAADRLKTAVLVVFLLIGRLLWNNRPATEGDPS